MSEIWKDIKGNREIYQISNKGNVRTKARIGARGYFVEEKVLTKFDNSNGYYRVSMRLSGDEHSKMYYVHRLVAMMFIPQEIGKIFVNHKDGNKHNNSVDNLEWVTRSENEKHAWVTGLKNINTVGTKGEKHGMHKLSQSDVNWIREQHRQYDSEFGTKALATLFNVSPQTITNIVNNKSWIESLPYSELITGGGEEE